MNALKEYVLTVTAASVLLAVVYMLAGQGTAGKLIRLIGGIFMALTVLSPLMQLKLPDVQAWFSQYSIEGETAAAEGAQMAEDARRSIIKQRTQAYIMDKAALYGAAPDVEVTLNADGVPVAVTLTGAVSEEAKRALRRIIAQDLGVGEEAQQWTGGT